jgi:hypothetical protein
MPKSNIQFSKQKEVYEYIGAELLIAESVNSSTFWNITPCSLLKVKDVSEEHVSISKSNQARNQREAGRKQNSA